MNIRDELITNADELRAFMALSEEDYTILKDMESLHAFSTTKYYASLIDTTDIDDPIKRMQIPMEFEHLEMGQEDTSGEQEYTKIRGLQHKYERTALLLVSANCAMYCRYCFRKRMVGKANDEIVDNLDEAFNYIREHDEIDNILLSGGDPLFQSNNRINGILEKAFSIKHIKLVRIGSRIPVVFPMRLSDDQELISILKKHGESGRLHIVTQFNHPRELTPEARKCIKVLHDCNIIVRNQSVLLKGVNDEASILADLFNKLIEFGIVPYYLYQCRPVKNVKTHFQLPLIKGLEIVEETKRQLNGIAKSFRFLMSTYNGKIEIIGFSKNQIYCKYNQALDEQNIGRVFTIKKDYNVAWVSETTDIKYI